MLFDIRQWNCSLFEYIYERKQKKCRLQAIIT